MVAYKMFSFVANTLYPNICPGCQKTIPKKEILICNACDHALPITDYFKLKDNPIAKLFWGKIQFENAASFLLFNKKGITQNLMHQLKYHGNMDIGVYLGKKFAKELLNSEFIKGIDGIIPLPLHPRKQAIRGYNQSECIAKGMAEVLGIDLLNNSAIRVVNNISQTKISAIERHKNVNDIFALQANHNLNGKHILIVDDTITTGATLESLGRKILEETNCNISFATIASVI